MDDSDGLHLREGLWKEDGTAQEEADEEGGR